MGRKKEQMQVVKVFLFLMSTLIATSNCVGQEKIIGEFRKTNPIIDFGVQYIFNNKNEFQKIENQHLGIKKVAIGHYSISEDSLVLQFEKPINVDTSTYTIIEKEKFTRAPGLDNSIREGSASINIQIVNKRHVSLSGANMTLNNKDGKIVLAFISDENGNYPPLSIQDNYIDKLEFSFVGCQTLRIRTDEFFGYASKTQVQLNCDPTRYSFDEKEVKYLIRERTSDKLVLDSIIEDEIITLIRTN